MKILHIVPTYFPAYRYGGPIKSVHELNVALVKLGVDVTVYTTNIDGDNNLDVVLEKEVVIDGVKVVYFPASFPRFWFYSKKLKERLSKTVKDFDLIHITSIFLSASTLGAYYAKKLNIPYIISPRGSLMKETIAKRYLKKNLYLKLIEKRNLKNASAIHFTTKIEENEYRDLGFPIRKSIVIPNGVDLGKYNANSKTFREKHNLIDNKVILFLSRISWKKGLDILIEALPAIIKEIPNAKLVIVGNDDEGYKKDVQLLISNLKLEDHIIFTGMLSGQDKADAYVSADVFVLPSRAENFGIVAVEAMQYRVPIIVSTGVAIAEDIKNAKAGIVTELNHKDISKNIIDVLNNQKRSKEMAERGGVFSLSTYSWDKIGKLFFDEYSDIIKK